MMVVVWLAGPHYISLSATLLLLSLGLLLSPPLVAVWEHQYHPAPLLLATPQRSVKGKTYWPRVEAY